MGMISCHCRTALSRMLSKQSQMTIGYILAFAVIKTFEWSNEGTESLHNAFLTSASSNKTASAFHLFRCLLAIKSANNA